MPLKELIFQYGAKPVKITDKVLLIRINQRFRPSMSNEEMYEATRGIWKLGPRRENAKYAFAVFEGVVREVYEIEQWFSAGTLEYKTRAEENLKVDNRWEFEGHLAPENIGERYVGGSVDRVPF